MRGVYYAADCRCCASRHAYYFQPFPNDAHRQHFGFGCAMFGEKALELVRELKRSQDGNLPPYNDDGIRQVVEEMRTLFEQNQLEVRATTDGERGLLSGPARCMLLGVPTYTAQFSMEKRAS